MAARSLRLVGGLGSVLVALVLSHSIVYLVRYGSAYGEALAHAGHETAWALAVGSTALLAGGLALLGTFQLLRLSRAATEVWPLAPASALAAARDSTAPGAIARGWIRASARLAAVTAVVLTVQENIERVAAGLTAPGPALLVADDYPWALAIVGLVSLAIGLVVTLFRWRRDALLARIRAARLRYTRQISVYRPNEIHHRPAGSLLGQGRALRAPPIALDS